MHHASEPKHHLYQLRSSADACLDLTSKQLIYCTTASKQSGRYGFMAYPAFRVAPWCSMRSSLSLGSKMLSSQGTPFSNSVARVGFSPMVPPLNSRTPSTAFPSSLAGPPIKPMSPTCACTHKHSRLALYSSKTCITFWVQNHTVLGSQCHPLGPAPSNTRSSLHSIHLNPMSPTYACTHKYCHLKLYSSKMCFPPRCMFIQSWVAKQQTAVHALVQFAQ